MASNARVPVVNIQLFIVPNPFTAVLVQQLVAVLQGAASQQQAALLLVVVDVYRKSTAPWRYRAAGRRRNPYGTFHGRTSFSAVPAVAVPKRPSVHSPPSGHGIPPRVSAYTAFVRVQSGLHILHRQGCSACSASSFPAIPSRHISW